MRNFIMFCLYTSLACLDSLVAGMAYISAALSMSFASPLAFLTLLPHSISQFFSGALLSSEMFVILMLYLWLGIGLACAGFCCHQMLLILRGQTRYQLQQQPLRSVLRSYANRCLKKGCHDFSTRIVVLD